MCNNAGRILEKCWTGYGKLRSSSYQSFGPLRDKRDHARVKTCVPIIEAGSSRCMRSLNESSRPVKVEEDHQ